MRSWESSHLTGPSQSEGKKGRRRSRVFIIWGWEWVVGCLGGAVFLGVYFFAGSTRPGLKRGQVGDVLVPPLCISAWWCLKQYQ